MIREAYLVAFRGKEHEWAFKVYGTEQDAEDWRADWLEVHRIAASVPYWINSIGMTQVWFFCSVCGMHLAHGRENE